MNAEIALKVASFVSEGWAWPSRAGRPHFFDRNGRSLCGHWSHYGALERGEPISTQSCKTCVRKAAERHAESAQP